MKSRFLKKITVLAAALALFASPALADDLIIQNQTISDARAYDSPEATILDHAVLTPTANVAVLSTYEVILKPGTRIQQGAVFKVTMRDVDGLPNRWEMAQCSTLQYAPGDDPDCSSSNRCAAR